MRVLVLERETAVRDRVRGEQMHPWGITEARKLGLYELLLETGGCEVCYGRGNSSALATRGAAIFLKPRRTERDH